jgi:alkylation response protein AidB-like acyl-CoA dehydrogenase
MHYEDLRRLLEIPVRPDYELVERAATIARERIAPRAAKVDAESVFPAEDYADLHEAGLLGLTIPKEYGGLDVDPLTYALCLREIGRAATSTALTLNMHSNAVALVVAIGSPEQKERYLREVTRDGKLIASTTSEPGESFRYELGVTTQFLPEDGGYRVKGFKHFCSLGDAAAYHFVMGVALDGDGQEPRIIGALVPMANPGVDKAGPWNAMGMRGTNSHPINFDTVISTDEIIGGPGEIAAKGNFDKYTVGYSAIYLGNGEGSFEDLRNYAEKRILKPHTEPLSHQPNIQQALGELETKLDTGFWLVYRAALEEASGDRSRLVYAANKAKWWCTEVALETALRAIKVVGGTGILESNPFARRYRDATVGIVMPPSTERATETIGRMGLGLEGKTLIIRKPGQE